MSEEKKVKRLTKNKLSKTKKQYYYDLLMKAREEYYRNAGEVLLKDL